MKYRVPSCGNGSRHSRAISIGLTDHLTTGIVRKIGLIPVLIGSAIHISIGVVAEGDIGCRRVRTCLIVDGRNLSCRAGRPDSVDGLLAQGAGDGHRSEIGRVQRVTECCVICTARKSAFRDALTAIIGPCSKAVAVFVNNASKGERKIRVFIFILYVWSPACCWKST